MAGQKQSQVDKEHSQSPGQARRHAARTLGVDVDASEEQRRKAYLKGIRAHPPEQDPQAFEAIRDAYSTLNDMALARHALVADDVDPNAPLETFLDDIRGERRFVGPGPWLSALSPWQKRQR